MKGPSLAVVQAEIAALRAVAEIELKSLNLRLTAVEATQRELVRVATQGKTGRRVLIWLGGSIAAAATAVLSFWDTLTGR